jgi:outer membrane receptor for ferrienterochelin and colicin
MRVGDMLKLRFGRAACSAVALIWAMPALAQEAGDAPPPETEQTAGAGGSRTYTPADFARFAPRTALDMLRQVPGFSIQGANQARGLGQASGNVLINGQRISGKSNDAVTELSRIPASSVQRIEIADGATLDIAGLSGQVANIIAKLPEGRGSSNGGLSSGPAIPSRSSPGAPSR